MDGRHRPMLRGSGPSPKRDRRDGRDAPGSWHAGVPSSADDPRQLQPTSSCAAAASRRWTRHGRSPTAARRPRRPDRRGRWRRCRARLDRAADPGRRAARPDGDARASAMRTSIRSLPASARCAATCRRARGLDAYLADHRGVRRRPPRRDVDPRRRLVDGRFPGRHPRTATTSIASCRIARSTSRAATATRPGSTRRRSSWPASPPTRWTPSTAASNATPTAGRPAPSRRERSTSSYDLLPADTPDELVAGLRLAQAELHALGVTNWQDASVIPESGEVAYTTLAGRGELTARVVGALWWDRDARRRADRGARRAARADRHRSLRPDQRQADPGRRPRELDRRGPRAVPRRRRPPDDEPRHEHDRARGAQGPRDQARRARVPAAFPRHRRAGRARGARRRRGRPARQRPDRHATAHRPHPGHPPGRHRAFPRARRHRQRPAVLGGPRVADGRAHDPAPRAGAVGLAVSVRLAPRGRRDPRDGLRLGRLDRRPAARDGGGGHPGQRRATAASDRRSSPPSGST